MIQEGEMEYQKRGCEDESYILLERKQIKTRALVYVMVLSKYRCENSVMIRGLE